MRSVAASRDLPAFAGYLLAVGAVMAIGGALTRSAIPAWYAALDKPAWTPPDWAFAPAWTILYVLMAMAAWLVWRRRRVVPVRNALIAWWTQLALNLAWIALFFGLRQPALALVEIAVLSATVAATAVMFHRVRPLAAALLLPYLAWLGFAFALNAAIVARL